MHAAPPQTGLYCKPMLQRVGSNGQDLPGWWKDVARFLKQAASLKREITQSQVCQLKTVSTEGFTPILGNCF
jgi:hypothetical protein